MARLIILNPEDRPSHSEAKWLRAYRPSAGQRWILWFGACAPTYLMGWGSLEDVLETCAEWLIEHEPGHLTVEDSDIMRELMSEAWEDMHDELMAEHDLPPDTSLDDLEGEALWAVLDRATADMTHTESGYLDSDDWGIAIPPEASRADVKAFIADLDARNYSDEPTVAVA